MQTTITERLQVVSSRIYSLILTSPSLRRKLLPQGLVRSPFEVLDFSLKEAAPEKTWLEKARTAISRAEVFIVMLGSKTQNAPGVLKEVEIANELKKPKFQIIGYKDGSEKWAVPNAGRVYRWNWENLKNLLK
ncbi:MAG: hypothetical protein IIA65_06275 [Planctomycetes bacterium]|nr:hypothetical protein [Planctomycetota bacterium]